MKKKQALRLSRGSGEVLDQALFSARQQKSRLETGRLFKIVKLGRRGLLNIVGGVPSAHYVPLK